MAITTIVKFNCNCGINCPARHAIHCYMKLRIGDSLAFAAFMLLLGRN